MTDEADEALDLMFDGDDAEVEAEANPEAQTEPEEAEPKAEVKTEPEPEDQPKPTEDAEPTLVPVAAVQDIRKKYQQLQEEYNSLKQKIPQNSEEPDMYDDPEGWKEWNRRQIAAEIEQQKQAELQTRVNASRDRMLETHADYTEREEIFAVLMMRDPSLRDRAFSDPDPAKFAYDKAGEWLDKFRGTKQEEALNKEIEKEAEKPAIDAPSLATATAQASNSTPKEEDYKDIDEMFEDVKY